MRQNIALLVGGWSAERDVSLTKGRAVQAALETAGYRVTWVEVTRDLPKLLAALTPLPDAVFNNLHGQGGEDGVIQGVLEMLGVPYTHSGVLASALGMDKPVTKQLAAAVGVRVPLGGLYPLAQIVSGDVMPRPYVIKPSNEGSSVGVTILRPGDTLPPDFQARWSYADALVEEYIKGRELTVAVLDGVAQGVTEIRAVNDFFDYDAKYADDRTEYLLPAPVAPDIYALALDYAQRVYAALGCRGLARCDFRYDDERGINGLYFLEINTQPGLTAASIGPSQVVRNGMSFSALCAHLIETATCQTQKTPAPSAATATPTRAVSA